MKRNELFINGKDAYLTWGVYAEDGTLAALMKPAPLKSYITNATPYSHGTQVADAPIALPKVDEREVQITLILRADNRQQFFARYAAFVEELQGGKINIETSWQEGVKYRCFFMSCTQFYQYDGTLAKFSLKLNEPNPKNRSNGND